MAADRTTFVGVLVPSEIKALPKILAALPPKHGPAILKAVVEGERGQRWVEEVGEGD